MFTLNKTLSVPQSAKWRNNKKTDSGEPPSKPPIDKELGSYCIRAEVDIYKVDLDDTKVGIIKGYDDNLGIVKRVEDYCEKNVQNKPAWRCGDTNVVILPNTVADFVCEGIYYDIDGDQGKIVGFF